MQSANRNHHFFLDIRLFWKKFENDSNFTPGNFACSRQQLNVLLALIPTATIKLLTFPHSTAITQTMAADDVFF
jgi:hypothetical protein